MYTVNVNFNEITGRIKPLHAVNNGPVPYRADQTRHNQQSYTEAGIPFARTHDASFCATYGGEHTVDIHMIFPDFDADPYDPASYDFHLTDEYMELIIKSGTEVFYRLGSKIEHTSKKYGTLPPKDFKKWAVICEHVIRHMNEGWGNGHHYGIRYWEIWNEPDLDADDSKNKRCWGGTEAEFFRFYSIAASHLKQCFPDLMIGGPALAHDLAWGERFLRHMSENRIPLDFFSWHIYSVSPDAIADKERKVRALLDRYGYTRAESILNEWNYIKGWSEEFVYSIKTIIGMKGAAFTASTILASQHEPLDMLMYYDARICAFNGLWDYYTLEPLKGYYPFLMFNELYRLGNAAAIDNSVPDVKAAAACSGKEKAVMLAFYQDDDASDEIREITLTGFTGDTVSVTVLDADRTMETSAAPVTDGKFTLTMAKNSVVLVKQN